ncbi:MAG TPA: hypothetical protein VK445_00825 [Dissulfurispiraceae bacterium]|nr:hypothetical protein [Dissulfurispiraceae bacterium]
MIPTNEHELAEVVKACSRMASRAGVKSAVVGTLPLPWIDAAVDIRLLSKLVSGINERFGLAEKQVGTYSQEMQIAVFDLAKQTGARFVGRFITTDVLLPVLRKLGIRIASQRAARFIPILGTAIAASISFGAMRLIAHIHIRECSEVVRQLWERNSRGPIIDITPGRDRQHPPSSSDDPDSRVLP